MGEPQLQARVQRHTVEQRIEHTPYVQILDAPVPHQVVVFFVSFPFALSGTADGGTNWWMCADGVVVLPCSSSGAECGANR